MYYDIKKMYRKSNPMGEEVGGSGQLGLLLFCCFVLLL